MLIDLIQYWENDPPNEGLVLSLEVDLRLRQLTVVYIYAAETVSRHFEGLPSTGYRDFRKIIFQEVDDFSAGSFKYTDSTAALRLLIENIRDSTICIVGYTLEKRVNRHTLKIELSSSFSLCLSFNIAHAEKCLAKGTQVGPSEWKYHKAEAGEEMDFYDPFA